ncbi:MAG: tRNA pseudouridine(55) synthase TruB [Caulobacteraceae bacterium]|nr:tRNA pseudouridine(55) synthase TruB [Caulobacteraceae bacterium]
MGRGKKGDPVSGWINLDKPYGLGSTPAVSKVRWLFNAQKAGHAGTLDPLADGILPIALGEATKTVAYLMDASKTYRFSIAWGRSTTTLDAEGETTGVSDVRPSPAEVEAALPQFLGFISQVPPAFSAIKVDGERAYDLARAGETVELAARQVRIDGLKISSAPDGDHIEIVMDCGKGAYVRSLARDLCQVLGAEGHVSALRRTRVGRFTEETAISLEKLEKIDYETGRLEVLLPVTTALDDIPALAVTHEDATGLAQGRAIVLLPRQVETLRSRLKPGQLTVSAMEGERLVALCEMRDGRLEPSRVFHSPL